MRKANITRVSQHRMLDYNLV